MQTLTQRRSVPVDAAKTAAIFGTLLIHASAAGGFAGAPGSFGWTSALFWNCLLRSAVPVFFLCSGALLLPPEKEVTIRRVWTKYIPRILAALFFWAAAYKGMDQQRAEDGSGLGRVHRHAAALCQRLHPTISLIGQIELADNSVHGLAEKSNRRFTLSCGAATGAR